MVAQKTHLLKKDVLKNSQKTRQKHVDVIANFNQQTMSIDSEHKINVDVYNPHNQKLTFEHAMLFAIEFKQVQANSIRNKALQTFSHENTILDYERGPYALFPKAKIIQIFRHEHKEPACLILTLLFSAKKMRTNVN